jgi:hypothetical protein
MKAGEGVSAFLAFISLDHENGAAHTQGQPIFSAFPDAKG